MSLSAVGRSARRQSSASIPEVDTPHTAPGGAGAANGGVGDTSEGEDHEAGMAARFYAGEPTALREVFDRYGPAVTRFVSAGLRDPADVDDVVQATFVSAWNGRATYDAGRAGLLTWLLAIARRRIVDLRRSRSRTERDSDAVAASTPRSAAILDAHLDILVDRLLVADELARLSAPQRRVLTLSFYAGLSHVEIAERTGMALGTVKSHLARGMHRLRSRLEENPDARFYTGKTEVNDVASRSGTSGPARP